MTSPDTLTPDLAAPEECAECGHHYHGDSMCFALPDHVRKETPR